MAKTYLCTAKSAISLSSIFSTVVFLLLLTVNVVTSIGRNDSRNPTDDTQFSQNFTSVYENELEQAKRTHLSGNDEDPTLLLVQVVFRHGDRSPMHSFPTDRHKDKWVRGYGQLTEVEMICFWILLLATAPNVLGMAQGLQLGQFLGRHYTSFLGSNYKPEQVYIQSTDKDRTLMTAQCVAAGLFPKRSGDSETWPFGLWQPFPVHTMPRNLDQMLSPAKTCDYVRDLRYGLKAYFYSKQDLMKDKELMFEFSKHSGLRVNFTTLHSLADTLYCQKVHNLSLPGWLGESIEKRLMEFYHHLPVLMPEEAKYLAGNLLDTMINNMLQKAHNPLDKHKLYLYSAHQGNLHSLMSLLGAFHKDTIIPYASTVMVELYRVHHKLFVKLLYKSGQESLPHTLHITGCKHDLCPLPVLTDLFKEPAQKSWRDVCGDGSQENVIDFGENTIPILVAVLVVFIGLDFFLLYKTFKYRQRLHHRHHSNGDRKQAYALVRTNAGSSSDDDDGNDDDIDYDEDDEISYSKNHVKDDTVVMTATEHHHTLSSKKKKKSVLNGGRVSNGVQCIGKGKGRISKRLGVEDNDDEEGSVDDDDHDDGYEETCLFVAPSRTPK